MEMTYKRRLDLEGTDHIPYGSLYYFNAVYYFQKYYYLNVLFPLKIILSL